MRAVVVDDRALQRDGRTHWLASLGSIECVGLTFEEAFAFGSRWRAVDVAVLDGHDGRSDAARAMEAVRLGLPPSPIHDRFLGPRVAEEIRRHTPPADTAIILVSAYARDDEFRARRALQARVDYIYEAFEVDSPRAFLNAVCRAGDGRSWTARRLAGGPDVRGAVEDLERSSARDMLLRDERHHDNQHLEWSLRALRQRLTQRLGARPVASGGPRQPQAARKSELGPWMRRALGLDLPVDREPGPPGPVPATVGDPPTQVPQLFGDPR